MYVYRLTGALLGVAVCDLAEDDRLAPTLRVHRVDRDVNASLDRGLQPGQGEGRLVRVGDVVEGLAGHEEVDVAVIDLEHEFLRQPAVISRHAFHLHAGVRLIRQRAVAHRKWLSCEMRNEELADHILQLYASFALQLNISFCWKICRGRKNAVRGPPPPPPLPVGHHQRMVTLNLSPMTRVIACFRLATRFPDTLHASSATREPQLYRLARTSERPRSRRSRRKSSRVKNARVSTSGKDLV